MIPCIDHSILSPSGRVSKRSREAAMKREAAKLFPPGFWDAPKKTDLEIRKQKSLSLRRSASNLRELAERGMSTGKFLKEAKRLEAWAEEIETNSIH